MRKDGDHNPLKAEVFFSEMEQEQILYRIWELLQKQAAKYNGVDSTSMPVEKAQDLLESLLYTIGVVMENGAVKEEILSGDLSQLIDRGRILLQEKKKSAKVEWKLLCQELPRIRNVYYLSTVKSLGTFFDKYDIYYGAHEIPCSIDYWLLCPISEKIKGISFIEEYIHRLQMENDFLNCFERNEIIALYKKYVPDYEETLFNLCDPVLTNAIGLALLGENALVLYISADQRKKLYEMLAEKSKEDIQMMIEQAMVEVCQRIGMTENRELNYFTDAAIGLPERVYVAVKHQDLSKIFISF